jgi:hypothetical protein
MERTDLNLTIEVGRRAERAAWDENTRSPLVPLEHKLEARFIAGKRRLAAWTYEKQKYEAGVLRELRAAYPIHLHDCPCDICDLGDRSEAWA